jgi:hypothetical protein
MDAIITLEEVMKFLKNPPSLAPRLDFTRLRALRQHIVRALRQLTCPQSPIHGWSGLAITPAMYLLLEPQPFVAPANPGDTAIYPQFAPPSTIKMIDAAFARDKNYYSKEYQSSMLQNAKRFNIQPIQGIEYPQSHWVEFNDDDTRHPRAT